MWSNRNNISLLWDAGQEPVDVVLVVVLRVVPQFRQALQHWLGCPQRAPRTQGPLLLTVLGGPVFKGKHVEDLSEQ